MAGCSTAPRAGGLFSADRTAALPFRVQSAEPPCLAAGQSVVDRGRPAEFGGPSLATAFPSVMAGDYAGSTGSSVPLRPLATQPAGAGAAVNTYCPVAPAAADPPSVPRWFDSVPALLPPPVDAASNLDAVRWPPRPRIDGLRPPRYPFSMEPPPPPPPTTTHCLRSQQSTPDTASSAVHAGGPSWSAMERSCLLNCRNNVDHPGAAGAGLMLGCTRRHHAGVSQYGDTTSLYAGGTANEPQRDTAGTRAVPPTHGMLSLLPHW